MEGMPTTEFARRIRRLNPRLWVDTERITYPYHPEYGVCGLYSDDEYILAVPQPFVPRWSTGAVNFHQEISEGKEEVLKTALKIGIMEDPDVYERILWRGYEVVVNGLINLGYLKDKDVRKEFLIEVQPKRKFFPRNFVHMDF
jgi:hypothetical protein